MCLMCAINDKWHLKLTVDNPYLVFPLFFGNFDVIKVYFIVVNSTGVAYLGCFSDEHPRHSALGLPHFPWGRMYRPKKY